VNLVLIQGCRFEEAALSRGDLTEVEWRILKALFLARVKELARRPPGPDWEPVNALEEK
jgi:hypothetical protein